MLFKIKQLQGIKSGDISLAFRKWKKPRVKKGSLIKTPVGVVEILDIFNTRDVDIREEDAIKAGFKNLEALSKMLNSRVSGNIYKIQVRYHSPDPRIDLRNQTRLSEEDFARILTKLERMNKFSKRGPWTFKVLTAIQEYPKLRAQDLAEHTGFTKDWLKPNIRKLKNLGLTISLSAGYLISPRGEVFLRRWSAE